MNDKIEGLLAEGRAMLVSGRPRDAALAFERVLLLAPADESARCGLDAAQLATAERERDLDERLTAAERRIEQGAHTDARALLDAVVRDGGSSDRAAALLDRIPISPGWFTLRRSDGEGPLLAPPAGSPAGRSRMMLGAVCAALFLLLGAAVAAKWDGLMQRLAQAPTPQETSVAFSVPPGPRAEDQTIAAARRLLEQGDPARAVALLDSVHPHQPAYPFARQLRGQAERALRQPGARR
ncbi:MAG: hypothetical protein ACHQ1G_11095 [Planctomycetota bacterium]